MAILANQVVKDENKKLRPGFRSKKKGSKAVVKKKISEFLFNCFLELADYNLSMCKQVL